MINPEIKQCSSTGVIYKEGDATFTPLPGAKVRLYYEGDVQGHSPGLVEVNATSNGYQYCSVIKTSQFLDFPKVTKIGLWAPSYKEKIFDIDSQDPCSTTLGPIGGAGLAPAEERWACASPQGACVEFSAIGSGKVEQEFDSQTSCQQAKCGVWKLAYNPSNNKDFICYDASNGAQPPVGLQNFNDKTYYLHSQCLLGQDQAPGEPTPTPTPDPNASSPTPTPEPHRPPCPTDKVIPGPNGEFAGCKELYTGLGVYISTDPVQFISALFKILLSISGGILLLLIIYSGYQMMTSQGNPERIQAARERITSAIIGFLFLLFSLVILEVIGVDILAIPGFDRSEGARPPVPVVGPRPVE